MHAAIPTASQHHQFNSVTITANGTANTKGSTWTTLLDPTILNTDWIMVSVNDTSASPVRVLVDIGIGASTAEQVLIGNVYKTNRVDQGQQIMLPLKVPSGARISARASASTASVTLLVQVTVFQCGLWPTYGTCVDIGAVVGSSRGSLITGTGWTEIIAANTLTCDVKGFGAIVGQSDDIAITGTSMGEVKLALGAPTAEQQFFTFGASRAESAQDYRTLGGVLPFIPCVIPKNQRLSGSGGVATELQDIILYGLY